MVSFEQANDIRMHLINQLTGQGFGDIIREAMIRLEYDEALAYREEPTSALHQFIEQIKVVFRSVSNSNFEAILSTLNNVLEDGRVIETIMVQPANDNEPAIDLRELPDYTEIIQGLTGIQEVINSER